MDPTPVKITLNNIYCYSKIGAENAEPYLWTVFFKIDGDTAHVLPSLFLAGTATVVPTPGNHGNLGGGGVDVGDVVPIPPAIGEFSTIVRPIPRDDSTMLLPGVIGCIVILLEKDNTPDNAVAHGHQVLNDAVQTALNQLIPTLHFGHEEPNEGEVKTLTEQVAQQVEGAISDQVSLWDWLKGFGDMDDKIGTGVFYYSQNQVIESLGTPVEIPGIGIEKDWRDAGWWRITGRVGAGDAPARLVAHRDLTNESSAPAAFGDPFGYLFDSQGVQNVVYRGTDGHAHELWRTAGGIGHSDLSALAGAPGVTGDPHAYVFGALGTHNVVYCGTDAHLHCLYWWTGAVGHDDLTALSHAPGPTGNPFGYVFDALGMQNVAYRGTDGHLHCLYWSTGAVGHDDLTALSHAPHAAGNPCAYVFDALGMQNVVYRGTDAHVHCLYWSTGAVGHDDLTALSGAPASVGDPTAYVAAAYGMQNVVYRGTDGRLHGLYWSTGAVGHDDLSAAAGSAPSPVGNPTAYFVAADATHHVIYRSGDGHLHELWWTTGPVRHNDLTDLAAAPPADGDPSAYFVAGNGTHHVIYRGSGHVHELRYPVRPKPPFPRGTISDLALPRGGQ